MKTTRRIFCVVFVLAVTAGAQFTYQKPPQAILDVLNAPPTPQGSLNPTRTHMLLMQGVRYPSIADLSQPMLRLAGLRINPRTNGPHTPPRIVSFTLKKIADGSEIALKLPPNAYLSGPTWSPDGTKFAFTNTTLAGIELWIGDTSGKVAKAPGLAINAVGGGGGRFGGGGAFEWINNRTLIVRVVPAGRGAPPAEPTAPVGPNVQESAGKAVGVATFEDMLKDHHDEALLEHYATAQLALFDSVTLKATPVGKPAIFTSVDASPDGKLLLVERVHRPFSYLHPLNMFPKEVEVWDHAGKVVYTVVSRGLEDRVPIEGVVTGPRSYQWRPTDPATLYWVEALDDGNPKNKVPFRDRLMTLKAPFTAQPTEVTKSEQRLQRVQWGEKFVLITDFERNRRWTRTFMLDPEQPGAAPKLLWERNNQNRYQDPGTPLTRTLTNGQRVIHQNGDDIFLAGQGATKQGDRPFLNRYNLKTGTTTPIFRCGDVGYESVTALLSDDGTKFLTQHESPTEPPNYFIRRADGTVAAFTNFPDRAPQLRRIKRQLVTYQREDGVGLSFTLYLPPDYKEGTRLPTILWAYPYEYNDADTASQISGSTQRFTQISGISQLFLVLAGYAVLDNNSMPVIGDSPETVNDTYVKQIVMDAKAAIDKAAEMGVTDRDRVGVGGHSYGAFMTANLLAHSDLFRAGCARSGAYNRTLTPFGFQSERRTFWEAKDTYLTMSPFLFADKIKTPLLMIHGEADNNSGTFPIQSERMYQAVRGNGGTVRLVFLPFESHGYAARESTEHTLWEMITWFDKWVKNAPPRGTAEQKAGN